MYPPTTLEVQPPTAVTMDTEWRVGHLTGHVGLMENMDSGLELGHTVDVKLINSMKNLALSLICIQFKLKCSLYM